MHRTPDFIHGAQARALLARLDYLAGEAEQRYRYAAEQLRAAPRTLPWVAALVASLEAEASAYRHAAALVRMATRGEL